MRKQRKKNVWNEQGVPKPGVPGGFRLRFLAVARESAVVTPVLFPQALLHSGCRVIETRPARYECRLSRIEPSTSGYRGIARAEYARVVANARQGACDIEGDGQSTSQQ